MSFRQSICGRDTETLVAAARIVFAAAALSAPYFDDRAFAPALSLAIVVYGMVGAGVLVTQSGLGRPTLARAVHALDLAFATVMLFAPGGASYFLMLATFALLSSLVHWRWTVVLLTGAYLLGIFLMANALGWISTERMTIRTAYLALAPIGMALAARSAADSRHRLLKLARWSSSRYSAGDDAVLRVFRHAADVLEAEEVTVFFHEIDQPNGIKTTYITQTDSLSHEACEAWPEETTAADLRSQPFVLVDANAGLCLTYGGMRRVRNPAPGIALSTRSGIVATGPFTGNFCSGRLFACGIREWRWDQIGLVEIVASHVRSRLEGRLLRDRTERITADLERMRLARDLHDGILQSLTAARLQLNALGRDAPTLQDRIRFVAQMLQDEQQKLREFVEDSRSASVALVPIARMAERIRVVADHWRLKASIQSDCLETEIPEALYRETYFIISEALANAARHGQASEISARLSHDNGILTLVICEEDGESGSALHGAVVPRSIDERIRELGGSLSIAHGPRGISMKMELPTHA